MTIEKLGDMQIAYMRRTGGYGEGNRQLMEQFKRYLREHALLQEDTTILGIALDDPAQIPEDRQRYDVGMILTGREDPCGLPVRPVAGGRWQYLKSPIQKRACQISGETFTNAQHGCLWTARDPAERDLRIRRSQRISVSFACPCGKASSGGFDA